MAAAKKQGAEDKLAAYKSRRNFAKTPEPRGNGESRRRKRRSPIFVIQKHAATRLHYDFRLEIDGVLKSWAVPKGPSTDPRQKRLAVETEDHPLEYADFEGLIPKGEYGAGTVIVWDAGTYRNIKKDRTGRTLPMGEAYERGQIEVWLEGKKLQGGYALIRTALGGQRKNWLLIKMKDEHADARRNPVSTQPESIRTGRTLEQVMAEEGAETV